MKLNANHGLYRRHRELNKILIRKINAYCEVKLTPKRKFIHTSYRYEVKRARLFRMQMGVAAMNVILGTEKGGGEQ